MPRRSLRGSLLVGAALLACTRAVPTEHAPQGAAAAAPEIVSASPPPADAAPSQVAAPPSDGATPALSLADRVDGPHELALTPERSVYYARPRTGAPPWRLIGHLHGICYPPSYSCGRWLGAAASAGVLVCPTGNARCGDAGIGPPSWEAPTWEELLTIMDGDLERSIAKVEAKHRGSIRRDGAVLTGFSRGAYAAPVIARMHPGRWPFLVLIEANVPLSAASLRRSGVRAVAPDRTPPRHLLSALLLVRALARRRRLRGRPGLSDRQRALRRRGHRTALVGGSDLGGSPHDHGW
ncbi:MAG TPA: hypothetical protein VLT33_03285 [Labilithrix sp.]|nr:hypothetical protein [Labilithrix sp.]